MLARYLVLTITIIAVLSIMGCKKKEERTAFPPGHPSAGIAMNTAGEAPGVPKIERTLDMPKRVKEKWGSVKLAIKEKRSTKTEEHIVPIGSALKVPNTKMTIKVVAYLPDFTMNDATFTSASADPNNPAVQVVITEPGRSDWKGWLYSLHPDVHPFEHETFEVGLVGGLER